MIIDYSQVGQVVKGDFRVKPQPQEIRPESGEIFEAAFRRENTIGSLVQERPERTRIERAFDPFDNLEGYEERAQSFAYLNSPEQVAAQKRRIDRERVDFQTLQDGGAMGFVAGLTAGVLDPINLVPVGGSAIKAYTMGGSILKGAGVTARAGVAGSTAAEVVLQGTQETRGLEESAVNIAGSAFLSGVLGGAVGYVGGKRLSELGKKIDEEFVIPAPGEPDLAEPNSIVVKDGSLSAAMVRDTTLKEETLSGALGMEKVFSGLNPTLRMATSPSVETRRYAQELLETPFYYDKNDAGIANPVAIETIVRMQDALAVRAIEQQNALFKTYKGRVRQAGDQSLSYVQFREEVSKALRRSDTHAIPEVQQVAKVYRKEVLDPLKKAAIEAKLLPEDVKVTTADSYLYRLWDKNKVAAKRDQLHPIIYNGLRGEVEKIRAKFDIGTELRQRNIQSEVDDLQISELRDDAQFADVSGVSEADIIEAIRQIETPPKKPETLISFLHKSGGLQESAGELRNIGLTNKARPGFVRKSGIPLDDAALKAWEAGFFPHLDERPEINDLLDALRDDFSGNLVVRQEDFGYAQELERLSDIQRTLDEMGVDVNKFKGLKRLDKDVSLDKLKENVNKIQKARRQERLKSLEGRREELAASRAEIRATQIDLSDAELAAIADDIINNILGNPGVRIPYDLPISTRGALKDRVLNFIRDEWVEDFLVNDIENVARQYIRTIAPDVAIQERFGQLDILGKDGVISQKINADYDRLAAAAKNDKERSKIQKQRKADLRDMDASLSQIRGTYGIPENPDSVIVRSGRVIRNLNYVSKLGGVTLSSFPDVARPVMVHGIMRTFKDGIVPLVTNLKGFKLSAREVKEAGSATDMVLNTRAMTLAELNDPYVGNTKLERGLQGLSNSFSKVTLMSQWNTAMKQYAGVVIQSRIVDSVAKSVSGKIKAKDARYLNMIGIDGNMAGRINKQLLAHGDDVDGVKVANTSKWQDKGAMLAYRAALKKEVDRTIITPGAGDIPLLFKGTEAGKMLGQFRSFSMAATNKVLISGLQEKDAAFINGVMISVAFGMLAYAAKGLDAGRELSDDPAVWVQEGVDRSGVLGILAEINQISNKATRGNVSLQALTGQPPLTRYSSANVTGVALGASFGTAQDVFQMTGAAASGEWTASDSRALRRVLPYQNLLGVRQIFDEMEEAANETLGVE